MKIKKCTVVDRPASREAQLTFSDGSYEVVRSIYRESEKCWRPPMTEVDKAVDAAEADGAVFTHLNR